MVDLFFHCFDLFDPTRGTTSAHFAQVAIDSVLSDPTIDWRHIEQSTANNTETKSLARIAMEIIDLIIDIRTRNERYLIGERD